MVTVVTGNIRYHIGDLAVCLKAGTPYMVAVSREIKGKHTHKRTLKQLSKQASVHAACLA